MKHAFAKAHQIAAQHRKVAGKKSLFAKAEDGAAELYVYDVIGQDWWSGGGVTAAAVVEALKQAEGSNTLNIYINSEGGDVFEAKAIYANLKRFAGEKIVHVDGIAASAATLIAMAGDRIITAPAATWMVHEAWSIAMGRAAEMREMANVLDIQNLSLAETYAARTGRTVQEMLEVMAAETWMSAKDALAGKFTDEIAGESEEDETETEEVVAAKVSPLIAAAHHTQKVISIGLARARAQNHSRRASPALRSGQP